MGKRRKYNEEFKKEAVNMLIHGDLTAIELAKDLDIRPDLLSRWKREYEDSGAGKIKKKIDPKDLEIMKLKKELNNIKMERDILKKSIAIFSKIS